MQKDNKTIVEQIEDICAEMCDKYCKFPEMEYESEDELYERHCNDCPLCKF